MTDTMLCSYWKTCLPGNDVGDSTAGTSFRLLANDRVKTELQTALK
jgi:hypothetical protein